MRPNTLKEYGKFKSDYSSMLFSIDVLESIIEHLRIAPGLEWGVYLQIYPMGGAFNYLNATETPFPSRAGSLMSLQYHIALEEGHSEDSIFYIWINNLEGTLYMSV